MGTCNVCGNVYDKSFEIIKEGKSYVFDSFECAINLLAPHCNHCNCKIVGHGMEVNDKFFCCAHCGKKEGEDRFKDRLQ